MQPLAESLSEFPEGVECVPLHGGPDEEGAHCDLDDSVLQEGFNILKKLNVFQKVEKLIMRYEIFDNLVIFAQSLVFELHKVKQKRIE